MIRMFKFSFAAVSMLAIGALAAPAAAYTRTESANIGMPGEGTSLSLFTSHLGAITYNGSGYGWWEIPLVADQTSPFPSGFEVAISGFAPSRAHDLRCALRLVWPDGFTYTGTPTQPIPYVAAIQTWDPGAVGSLPSNGSAVVDCWMGTGSRISNVTILY